MPFTLVITREGGSDAVCVAPSGWVVENTLFWPGHMNSHDLQAIRRIESSVPGPNWTTQGCRVKCEKIDSFSDALRLEKTYAKFDDTEDEERYVRNRQNQRAHPTTQFVQLLDLNSEFSNIINSSNKTNEVQAHNVPDIDHQNVHEPILPEGPTPRIGHIANTVKIMDVETLLKENSFLKDRIKYLEKQVEYHLNQDKKFSIVQVMLDKVLEQVNRTTYTDIQNNSSIPDDGTLIKGVTFPIETITQLETLEIKLSDKEVEAYMVNKFSQICGKNGTMKMSKIALKLIRHLITDEVLYQCTWKGIKGTTKLPFINLKKIRGIFFKILNLADGSCTQCDADTFLQHSAVKHSGQRLKRKLLPSESSSSKKSNVPGTSITGEDDIMNYELIPENCLLTILGNSTDNQT